VLQAGEAFVRSIPVTSSTDAEAGWFRRLLEGPLTELAISGLLDDVADDVAATLTALQPLRSAHLPLVIVHGDLGHPNLVLTPEGLMGALDWERAELAGLPLFDACFFLQYVSESRRGAFTRAAQLRCFDEVFTGSRAWGAAVLHREADRLGVDRALVPPLVLATWAVSAAGLLRRVLPPRTGQGAPAPLAHLPDVLETFAEDRDVALWRHAVRRFSRISIN
jgi:hypothetical protein